MPDKVARPRRWILKTMLGLVAAVILLLATGMGLFRLLTATVPGYRAEVERWAAHRIGFPLAIGTLTARWHGFGPELVLDSVALESLDRKHILAHAASIHVRFSLPVLLENLRLMPSGVVVRGMHLTVTQNTRGRLVLPVWMSGKSAAPSPDALLAILVADIHFGLEDVALTLARPPARGGPVTLELKRLSLRADDDRYRLHLTARVTPGLPGGLTLRVRARGPRRAPGRWHWRARLQMTPLALRALDLLPGSPSLDPTTRLALTARLEGIGPRPLRARGKVSVEHLYATPAAGTPASGYREMATHFVFDRASHVLELAPLTLTPSGGHEVRERLGLGWSGPIQAPTGIHLASTRLELGAFAPLGALSALAPSAWRKAFRLVATLDPVGTLTGLDMSFAVGPGGIRLVSAAGHFQALGWQPLRPIPGLVGLNGDFSYAGGHGVLTLERGPGRLFAPWLFEHPIPFETRGLSLHGHLAHGSFALSGPAARIRFPGLALALGAWSLMRPSPASAPRLTLHAQAVNVDPAQAVSELPLKLFGPHLIHWLQDAFVSGVIPKADFVFKGPPGRFPFKKGGGLFRVRFTLGPSVMHVAPGWPDLRIQAASGEFLDAGLNVRMEEGQEAGIPLAGDTLSIPDLGQGLIRIHGSFAGPAQSVLRYLDATPLAKRWGGFLPRLALAGPLRSQFAITLPVGRRGRFRIGGVATLLGVRARYAHLPAVSDLRGTVDFDNLALQTPLLTGVLARHRITVNAWTRKGQTHVQLVGELAPGLLRGRLSSPWLAHLQGLSMWRAVLRYTPADLGRPLHLAWSSDLVGTRLILPAPIGKAGPTPVPLSGHARLDPGTGLWSLDGHYGKVLQVDLTGGMRNSRLRVKGIGVTLGPLAARPPPVRGLLVRGSIGTLDLEGWWSLRAGTGKGSLPWQVASLTISHLTGWGEDLPDVTVNAHPVPGASLITLAGPDLAGQVRIPDRSQRAPIVLDFARIRLAPIRHLTKPGSATPDPGQIPALDLTSAVTDYGRMALGRLSVRLRDQGAHTLLIPTLAVTSKDLDLTGHGRWSRVSGHSQAALALRITSPHLGHAFHHLGLTRILTGHHALVTLALHWQGRPWHPDLATLDGQIHFGFKNGRVLSLKPGGAGRLIALLSLNALPRILGFDFSDVFARGLAYDRLSGDFVVKRGIASTRNVELFGPSIALWMTGRANLAKRSYDQVALVVPHVGSTLPIAGMIFGGPVGGGIMLAISRIFQGLIQNVTQAYYHITGTWSHPVVKKIGDDRARALGFVKPKS